MYSITIMWIDDGFVASATLSRGVYDGVVYRSEPGIRYPNPHEAAISVLNAICGEQQTDVPQCLANASEATQQMYANTAGMGI